ncbi:hypothetical protein DFH28DRAFT_925707 [Melampsora americana]|nr:hypothetical protein DFH28DRAFT_925707 [Melampsora americana]
MNTSKINSSVQQEIINHHHHQTSSSNHSNLNQEETTEEDDEEEEQQEKGQRTSLTDNLNYLDSYLDSTNNTHHSFKPFQFQSQHSTEPLTFDPITLHQFSNLFPNLNSTSTLTSTSNLQSTLSYDSDQPFISFGSADHHDQLSINPNLLSPKFINQSDHQSHQTYPLSDLIQTDHLSISPFDSNSHPQLLQTTDHQAFNQAQSSTLQISTKNQTHPTLLQSSPEPHRLIQSRKPSDDGLPNSSKRVRTEKSSKPNSILTDESFMSFLEPSPIISSSSSHHHNSIHHGNQDCSTPKFNSSRFDSNSNHQNHLSSEQAGSNFSHQYRSQYQSHHNETPSDQSTTNQSIQYRSSIDQTSSPNPKPPNSSTSITPQQTQPNHHHLTHDFTKRKDWAKKVMEDVMDLCLLIDEENQIKFVSSSLNQLTGYQHRDWMNTLILNWLFDKDDEFNFINQIEKCNQDVEKEVRFYTRIKKRDGSCLILEICAHKILSENSIIPNSQLIFISGRKYPSSASKLSDRIFDLRLENERLLKSLFLIDSSNTTHSNQNQIEDSMNLDQSQRLKEKEKKNSKMNKKSMSCKARSSTSILHSNLHSNGKHRNPKSISTENELVSEFVCKDCGTTISPEWRKGPTGPKTLCNACGLRWAKKAKPTNS